MKRCSLVLTGPSLWGPSRSEWAGDCLAEGRASRRVRSEMVRLPVQAGPCHLGERPTFLPNPDCKSLFCMFLPSEPSAPPPTLSWDYLSSSG